MNVSWSAGSHNYDTQDLPFFPQNLFIELFADKVGTLNTSVTEEIKKTCHPPSHHGHGHKKIKSTNK